MTMDCMKCGVQVDTDYKYIGAFGAMYAVCPCCGNENLIDDEGIELTEDNLEFPRHFAEINRRNGYQEVLDNAGITENVKLMVDYLKASGMSAASNRIGDTFIAVLGGADGFNVMVSRNYFWTAF